MSLKSMTPDLKYPSGWYRTLNRVYRKRARQQLSALVSPPLWHVVYSAHAAHLHAESEPHTQYI